LNSDESNNLGSKQTLSGSDCVKDTDDEENVYLGNNDVNEMLGECDPHHLLYIFKMILSFHAWYNCGAQYSIGGKEGYNNVDNAICKILMAAIKMHTPPYGG